MRHLLTVTAITVTCICNPVADAAQGARTDALRRQVEQRIQSVPDAEVAVSFRDLGSGETLDIRADVDFHAARTMKIPVMLEVLRSAESGRISLDQGLLLVNRFHSIVDGSPYELSAGDDSDSSVYARVGERVPVRELMERMIVLRGVEDSKAYSAGRNNTTTSADLAVLLERIEKGGALKPESVRIMWAHMSEVK